ncbi:WYL domain-containing protein [Peptococcaceae bacterium]|nr:WYL domain-containing protein [Peptococcaceae bacterium]
MNEEEMFSFLAAEKFLEKDDNYIFLKAYKRGIEKIKSVFDKINEDCESQYILKFSRPNVDMEKERKKYFDILNSIISRRKLKIKYFSLTSGLTERIIMPYVVVMYKGFWYCIGHCEMREEIRFFKLSRIRSYEVMEDNFEIPADFKLTDYIGHNSIFKDKLYKVKLRIKFPMSIIISERIWSEDQKIKFNKDDNSILFEATMSGLPEIKTWILSMGSYAEVIQPKGLYEEIKNEVKKLKNLYKD